MPGSRAYLFDPGAAGDAAPPLAPNGRGIIGWLRNLYDAIVARWNTLGQKSSALSAPVVLSTEDKDSIDAILAKLYNQRDSEKAGRTAVQVSIVGPGTLYTVPGGRIFFVVSCWISGTRTGLTSAGVAQISHSDGSNIALACYVPGAHAMLGSLGSLINAQDGVASLSHHFGTQPRQYVAGEVVSLLNAGLASMASSVVGYTE